MYNNLCNFIGLSNSEDQEYVLVPQSGEERHAFKILPSGKDYTAENVSFQDKNPAYHYEIESSMDATRGVADMNDADLGSFFERPIKIASFDWGVGTSLFEDFDPWALYFTNPRVINRISNFNNMRANLNLKVVINGNGFFYGRALMSYQPLPGEDDATRNRALIPQDLIGASQRPHIYIDPTYSTGGSMTLPFLWFHNTLSIPLAQWGSMGDINIRSLNDLKHANGASEQVTISVFAWASNVELSVPTSTDPGSLVPQAGDEYGDGPVSKPASVLARMAGALVKAPIIGTYARATELAASTVADVARLFGYSRPNVIDPSMPTVIRPVGNLANTNVDDTALKLAYDVKQELTIDPRITGVGSEDEMEIRSIAMRESYLCQFPWPTSTGPEALLWNSVVTPNLFDKTTTGDEFHLTPAAHVTLPFKYWRGSMEFRFQIVASNFHKGRLAISYDPYFHESYEYNTQYTHIVDIASDKDFTVKVGWGSPLAYLQTRDPQQNSFPWSTSQLTSPNYLFNNGFIAVRVLNELTSPNSTINNDVAVNVFVKMCDDFEVAVPTDNYRFYSYFPPSAGSLIDPSPPGGCPCPALKAQAGDDEANAEDTPEPSVPVSSLVAADMAACLDPSDMMTRVHFGEEITSIRSLMKRYNFYGIHGPPLDGASYLERKHKDFPLYRGFAPNGVHTNQEPVSVNYYKMTMINWFTPCFSTVRGGMRWKYHYLNAVNAMALLGAVRNDTPGGPSETLTSIIGPAFDSMNGLNSYAVAQLPGLNPGAAETNTIVDPCVEVELPFYSQRRFCNARSLQPNNNSSWAAHTVYSTWNETVPQSGDGEPALTASYVRELVSVGEDFSLNFYLSVPPIWFVPNLGAPL